MKLIRKQNPHYVEIKKENTEFVLAIIEGKLVAQIFDNSDNRKLRIEMNIVDYDLIRDFLDSFEKTITVKIDD